MLGPSRRIATLAGRVRGSESALVAACSLVARFSVLGVLVAAAARLGSDDLRFVTYMLAVTSAIQILTDPNVAQFLVVTWPSLDPGRRRSAWRAALLLQVLTGLAQVALCIAVALLVGAGGHRLATAAALGALVAAEALLRGARAAWQAERRFKRYALSDIGVATGRVATAAALVVAADLRAFSLACLAVAVLLVVAATLPGRGLPRGAGPPYGLAPMARDVWPYAASTTVSAVYSQFPGVLLGVLGGVQAGAVYAVATRLTQPLDLVPNAISSTYLPRLVAARGAEQLRTFGRQLRSALAWSVTAGVLILATSPLLLELTGSSLTEAGVVLVILVLVLPVKFSNHQLVALAIAQGKVRRRLRASAIVAVISVVGVALLAPLGPEAVALVALGCELTLAALLVRTAGLRAARVRLRERAGTT